MDFHLTIFDQISPIIFWLWDKLLNSNFTAALAGAWLGAFAADRIATRKARGQELSDQIKNFNSAIALAGLISNHALALKRQHVLSLHMEYSLEDARFADVRRRLHAGAVVGAQERNVDCNLAELSEFHAPIDTLSTLVLDKVGGTRAIGLVLAMQNAFQDLNFFIRKRNGLCENYRDLTQEQCRNFYFGLPFEGGQDNTYPHCIYHIYQATNDLAFFGAQLAADLQKNGGLIAEKYGKLFRTNAPFVNSIKFDTPRALELLPPEIGYSDFLSMFHDVASQRRAGTIERLIRSLRRMTAAVRRAGV